MKLFPKKPTQRGSTARRTLEAAVARRASRSPMIEEEEEPTTSFKTALVVVLLLHVVAGAGVLMFDRIKTRRLSHVESAASVKKEAALSVAAPVAAPAAAKAAVAAPAPVETANKSAPAAPVAAAAPARPAPVAEMKDSGATYSVVKGDKLASIARKLKVNYDDLLKLNKINDPKKLRIGQKLRIPVKPRVAAN